jgi:hypothetical protein
MSKTFKSPDKNYAIGNFRTTRRPRTPSPKRRNYQNVALTKDDKKSRCTYIHPQTGKRCHNKLGLYPEYCEMHTMLIHNVFIAKSSIEMAGNGLFAGPYGFKKGDKVGKYSHAWNEVKLGTLHKRCSDDNCWSYVFCNEGEGDDTKCWDGLDIRSTLMRNINDAYKSGHRNNCYFDVLKGQVYVIASRNIKPYSELYVSYNSQYWQNRGE